MKTNFFKTIALLFIAFSITSLNAQVQNVKLEQTTGAFETQDLTLSPGQYQFEIANNGEEALVALKQDTFVMALMDCQMPVLDGYETTRQIRVLEQITGEHLVIVAMTANAMTGDRELCLESGMDDYISKPIAYDVLQQKIQQWMPEKSP